MPEVSPVGVGDPTVGWLATPSHRIWCVPTWRLEEPDIVPSLVRHHRQTVPFSHDVQTIGAEEAADISARGISSPQQQAYLSVTVYVHLIEELDGNSLCSLQAAVYYRG